jgi:tRNA(fMet)-specific endonuclease VapC
MARYMLDTDISSFIIKRSNDKVLARLEKTPVQDVCISAITKSELMYGVEISSRPKMDRVAVEAFLHYVAVLGFGDAACEHYAAIRAHLKRKGTPIGAHDLFIAAHARSLSLILVTNNVSEFRRVPHLSVENWAA